MIESMRILYLESGRLSSLPYTIFEKFSEKLRMLAGVRSKFSIGPKIKVGRMPVDDLEDHRFGGIVMIDTGNHISAVIAGFPFGGESLAPVHLFGDRRVRSNRNGDDVAGHVDSSSEGEIGFEFEKAESRTRTSPAIGPLSATVFVREPDWHTISNIGSDHAGFGFGFVDMLFVVHASIVPEGGRKARANKRNPEISILLL